MNDLENGELEAMEEPLKWTGGDIVKVGFMTLKVLFRDVNGQIDRYSPVPYILESSTGVRYRFTPYQGLERINR